MTDGDADRGIGVVVEAGIGMGTTIQIPSYS